MAEPLVTLVGIVLEAPTETRERDDWGNEFPVWHAKVVDKAGETFGTTVDVADPKAAEVLRSSVGKRVSIHGRVIALPKRAGGAWYKVKGSSVAPAA